jgi:hypothetical protein
MVDARFLAPLVKARGFGMTPPNPHATDNTKLFTPSIILSTVFGNATARRK